MDGLSANNNTKPSSKISNPSLSLSSATLKYVQTQFNTNKITVDLGEGVLSEGKRINDKIVLRVKEDLYVEFSQQEAEKLLPSLISLY